MLKMRLVIITTITIFSCVQFEVTSPATMGMFTARAKGTAP